MKRERGGKRENCREWKGDKSKKRKELRSDSERRMAEEGKGFTVEECYEKGKIDEFRNKNRGGKKNITRKERERVRERNRKL